MEYNHIKISQKTNGTLGVLMENLSDLTGYVPYLSVKNKTSDASIVINYS